jgi:predicted metalloprotease
VPGQKVGCGQDSKGQYNAFYCGDDDSVSWDRGGLLPDLRAAQGPIAVVAVLAHEFGHAIQFRLGPKAGMANNTPTIVKEQQADCFAGAYFRWVAEGKSKYVTMSTAEGLNSVVISMLHLRDAVGNNATRQGAHGSGFDRTYALRVGFEKGPKECAAMNMDNISARITEKSLAKQDASSSKGDTKIDQSAVELVKASLDAAFKDAGVPGPQITDDGGRCSSGKSTPPASFCPGDNTISIDMPTLATMAQPIDHKAEIVGKAQTGRGDFAAFGEIASRYALAVQKGAGASVDGPNTGLRTACLVGAWAKFASAPPSGVKLRLSPGDLDEAIGEMLQEKSVIAADINGDAPTTGFDRVQAMQNGYLQGSGVCSPTYP